MRKICGHTTCKKEKDVSEFFRNKRSVDGYQSWCKDCMNAAIGRWAERNPKKDRPVAAIERNKRKMREWYAKHKSDHKKSVVEYNRQRMKDDVIYRIRQNMSNTINARRRSVGDVSDLGYTMDQFVARFMTEANILWLKGIYPRIGFVVPKVFLMEAVDRTRMTPVGTLFDLDNIYLYDPAFKREEYAPVTITSELYDKMKYYIRDEAIDFVTCRPYKINSMIIDGTNEG